MREKPRVDLLTEFNRRGFWGTSDNLGRPWRNGAKRATTVNVEVEHGFYSGDYAMCVKPIIT